MAFTIAYNIKAIDQFTGVSKQINAALASIESNVKKVNAVNKDFAKRMGNVASVAAPTTAAIRRQSTSVKGLTSSQSRNNAELKEINRRTNEYKRSTAASNMKIREHALATSIANRKLREANKYLADNKRKIAARNRALKDSIQLQRTVGAGMSRAGTLINTRVTLPLLAAGGASVKFAMDFNKSMASVGTLIPGQTEKLKGYKKEVLDLSVKYAKGSDIVAAGLYQVISNVGDTADTMKILDISNKAAVAGVAQTADSVNLLTGIASDYGNVSAEMVQHLSDLAFKTVELGSTTFPELANQMGKTTTLAATLGVGVEELFGSYAGLTSGTVKTAQVSTRLAGVMRSLLNGAGDLGGVFKKLGVESGDQLVKKYGGLQKALFAVKREVGGNEIAFSKLFTDQEAKLAALALTGAKSKEAAKEIALMGKASGATAVAFKEQTKGIGEAGFKMDQSIQKIKNMSISIGDRLMPQVVKLLNAADPIIDWLGSMDEGTIRAALNMGILAAKFGIAFKALGLLLSAKAGISSLAGQIGGAGAGAGTLTGSITASTAQAGKLSAQLRTVNGQAAVISSIGAGYAIGQFIHQTWMQPAEDRQTARETEIGNIYAKASMRNFSGVTDEELADMRSRVKAAQVALPKSRGEAAFQSPSSMIQTFVSRFDDSVEAPMKEINRKKTEAMRAYAILDQEMKFRSNMEKYKEELASNGTREKDTIEVVVKAEPGTSADAKHVKKGKYTAFKRGNNVR